MQFDDHEIWGAPVQGSVDHPDTEAPEAAPVPSNVGRLYRSAGSEPHPDAVVALPNHKPRPAESPAAAAPISINSRIPRPAPIEDAAIAEVLATPAQPVEHSGFTSWFRQSGSVPSPAQSLASDVPAAQVKAGIRPSLPAIPTSLDALRFTAFVTLVTVVVAVVNALVGASVGLPTGIALVASTAVGAWLLEPGSRWVGWVMPSYIVILASLISGPFVDGAPGFSILGNALLVVTSLITLAPWLALATIAGVVMPAVRARRP